MSLPSELKQQTDFKEFKMSEGVSLSNNGKMIKVGKNPEIPALPISRISGEKALYTERTPSNILIKNSSAATLPTLRVPSRAGQRLEVLSSVEHSSNKEDWTVTMSMIKSKFLN
jgi:hypothetical protein